MHASVQAAPSRRDRRTRYAHTSSRAPAEHRRRNIRSLTSSSATFRLGSALNLRPFNANGAGPATNNANDALALSSGNGSRNPC
ncbi:hypothetical protein [Streptomyces sp. NRRL F-5123]|uniref:hypothetical protein n=1 Tax=Streptomyces sp. NRRL F-5123 TaxID=1463856 RepID=UPI001F1594A1|nr:hypothetical protein [Streptomyces sp. NRRL F-5123]